MTQAIENNMPPKVENPTTQMTAEEVDVKKVKP